MNAAAAVDGVGVWKVAVGEGRNVVWKGMMSFVMLRFVMKCSRYYSFIYKNYCIIRSFIRCG